MYDHKKYQPYPPLKLAQRQWPDQTIQTAPIWCSVDLRDGNQALINPMSAKIKQKLFNTLVAIGFKEIEIGFPAAAAPEFEFTRQLIEQNLVPADVTVQVLCQARNHLIDRTIESLKGVKQAIFHLYNSTSTLQRDLVFNASQPEVIQIAVQATQYAKQQIQQLEGSKIQFEYTPESFTGTEMDFALEICEAVMEAWQPTADNKIILNLPATVEMSTPNIHADQIEWFCSHLKSRDLAIISLHTHNDRGCAVAATELALMAGADRVEGTLFGNGERTGNVDIVTLALNLFTQGVDPQLDFSNINEIKKLAEACTQLPVHQRHPYAGELVYTAFSGSHQDAIKKGVAALQQKKQKFWQVPYLPINPEDIGRFYEPIIRINSQSGKSGVAYILEHYFGYKLPKLLQIELSQMVQPIAEKEGELSTKRVLDIFLEHFSNPNAPCRSTEINIHTTALEVNGSFGFEVQEGGNSRKATLQAVGNGPVDVFTKAVKQFLNIQFKITEYIEHALSKGSDAQAACYIQITFKDGQAFFGVGTHHNTVTASYQALLSAVNHYLALSLK